MATQSERNFRENDEPFGEHVARVRSKWFNLIELWEVFNHLKLPKRGKILDIGCADGRFLEYAHSRAPRSALFGIDYARNPLKKCLTKEFRISAACADACDMPFKPGLFSAGVSIQVVQHFSNREERLRALQAYYDVLQEGAKLVVTVLNQKTWYHSVDNLKYGQLKSCPQIFVHLFNEKDLREDLENAGFVVNRISGINNLPTWCYHKLGFLVVILDIFISECVRPLSLMKGSYLLAECTRSAHAKKSNRAESLLNRFSRSTTFSVFRKKGVLSATGYLTYAFITDMLVIRSHGYIMEANLQEIDEPGIFFGDLQTKNLEFHSLEPGVNLPEFCYGISSKESQSRLKQGHRCFYMTSKGAIVCAVWIGLGKINYPGRSVYLYSDTPVFSLQPDQAWLYDLVCDPVHRGKGWTTLLVREALKRCKELGMHRITATVGLSNVASIKVMLKNKFQILYKVGFVRLLFIAFRKKRHVDQEFTNRYLGKKTP
jgi:SAM-dependent methyltransferase/RimJ/RimL family protein N-acetyltransferase